MLNPSTADAENDDPTIRSCVRIARHLAGSLSVVKLFAYRANDQKKLLMTPNPIGRENDQYIIEAAKDSDLVIAAWGREKLFYKPRVAAVRRLLYENGIKVSCLGLTKDGFPRHPLYLPGSTLPRPYAMRNDLISSV